MQPPAHKRHVRTDIWKEGKYVDLWSIPHFFSGICVALGLSILGLSTLHAITTGFILLVLYEVFEWVVDIEETKENRVMDVVIGMTSMLPMLLFLPNVSHDDTIALFIVLTTGNAILSWFGWRASQKAATFQAVLHKDFERGRERIKAGRARIAKRLHRKRKEKVQK